MRAGRGGRPPGTVYRNNGYWYWRGTLPGEARRRAVPLRMPGAKAAMPCSRPRADAEAAAWRVWTAAGAGAGTPRPDEADPFETTVEEICAAWTAHASVYYRRQDGSATSEAASAEIGVRMFRGLYGPMRVSGLSHADMLRLRGALEASGVARTTVNKRIGMVKRMIRWALDGNLVPPAAAAELCMVAPLKRNRSQAPERGPVTPAPPEDVEAVARSLPPDTADMVRVHLLTGMRPSEICGMRFCDIDRSREPWLYRPAQHKNLHRGMPRVVLIGPRARGILLRHSGPGRCFSPAAAAGGRAARPRGAPPGGGWTADAYGRAVRRACERLGLEPWSPNRLRHSFATEIRRKYGAEAAAAALGHSTGGRRVTDVYSFGAAEDEIVRAAAEAVEDLG